MYLLYFLLDFFLSSVTHVGFFSLRRGFFFFFFDIFLLLTILFLQPLNNLNNGSETTLRYMP